MTDKTMSETSVFLVFIIQPLSIAFLLTLLYFHRNNIRRLIGTDFHYESDKHIRQRARPVKEGEERAREQPIYPRLFEDDVTGNQRSFSSFHHAENRPRRGEYEMPKMVLTNRDIYAIQNILLDGLLRRFPNMPNTAVNMRMSTASTTANNDHATGHSMSTENGPDASQLHSQVLHRVDPVSDLHGAYQNDRASSSSSLLSHADGNVHRNSGSVTDHTNLVNRANRALRRTRRRRNRVAEPQISNHDDVQNRYDDSAGIGVNGDGSVQ
ncbi:hypothetical protein DM02DRAFT_655666 [Periconia macrospinosa]|uniref:Uncharacterized protein n=1 Tax=Periconia macrospinosa TaxID=97972 RepID=A0A2V1DSM3_9PLEO|nr:hypothetical protein DM02DRAFT_655666 [Periconia macrospinosa]